MAKSKTQNPAKPVMPSGGGTSIRDARTGALTPDNTKPAGSPAPSDPENDRA